MSNRDVERLLCGNLPANKALTPLAPILSAFHNVTWPAPADEAVATFASAAATIARSATPSARPKPSPPARSRFLAPALQRGLATGLAGVLLVSGLAGVAVASDDSAPGDLLYGLDRALESIGVGDGGATERVAEAWALLERGQIAEAVGHALRTVGIIEAEQLNARTSNETANHSDALRFGAGDTDAADDEDGSLEVRAAVAALLREMAAMLEDPALEGESFGQSVAEMARLLGANDSFHSGPGQPGTGEPEPGQPGPGNSDQAFTPPFDSPPGPDGDSAAPADPPGKSDEAPGKTDSSPGKSGENPAGPPIGP